MTTPSQNLVPSQVVTSFPKKSNMRASKVQAAASNDNNNNMLVPAQVNVHSKIRQKQHRSSNHPKTELKQASSSAQETPQAVERNQKTQLSNDSSKKEDKPSNNKGGPARNSQKKNNNRRRKPSPPNGRRNGAKNYRQQPRFGNLPDIEWGSISMEDLRLHPRFVPLPLPEDLPQLTSVEDVRYIRQDSWQWDALHDGRCTTSQAVAALGFLEHKAGKLLGIPSTWQRRGLGAYHRLQQRALRTLDEMNAVLLADNAPEGKEKTDNEQLSTKLWKEAPQNNDPFVANFLPKLSNREKKERRRKSIAYADSGMGIRMMWGNAQEATSVLTALNYFTQQDPDVVLKEIGMCGAGLALNQTDGSSPSSLLIGATPDAIIEHPDGSIEAVEVKNHCPFVLSRPARKKGIRHKQFAIRELPFRTPYIFPLYVPQLQLEMNCLGPECRSAIMVRQTATNGALILRIHRDDEWMDEMLYWLQRFQQDFVEKQQEPMANFFYESPTDGSRYLAFLERTKGIANQVDLVAEVPHKVIQRANQDQPLFLD